MATDFMRNYGQRRMATGNDFPQQCRYISGQKPYGDKPYCDDPTKPGSSYCAPHHAMCWVPADEEITRKMIQSAKGVR